MDDSTKIRLLRMICDNDINVQIENLQNVLEICETIQYLRVMKNDSFSTRIMHDNNLLYQKSYLHGRSILTLSKGLLIKNKELNINQIISDPLSINVLFRALLETYLTFYHINFASTKEEIEIIHLIWDIHGLYQRQRIKFVDEDNPLYAMNLKKLKEDKLYIDRLILKLKESSIYSNLTEEKQNSLIGLLKRDWKISFHDSSYKRNSYHQILESLKIQNELFKNIYNNLSWSAHSTSVIIAQFKNLWDQDRSDILFLKNALLLSNSFLSFMTVDMIKNDNDYYPCYKRLSNSDKDLLNYYNYFFRGDDRTIEKVDK